MARLPGSAVNSWCSLNGVSRSGRCGLPPGIIWRPWCVPSSVMPRGADFEVRSMKTEERWSATAEAMADTCRSLGEGRWVWVPFEVDKKYDGYRIDRFLAQRLVGYSRNRVQGILAEARVLKEDRPAKANTKVRTGEKIQIAYLRRPEAPLEAEASIPILYEDADLVIVNKPGNRSEERRVGKECAEE